MKGNKDNNAEEKRAINHDTVIQHMGTIQLTSTNKSFDICNWTFIHMAMSL